MWANGHALVRPEKPSRGSTQPRATARVAANRLSARHHRPLRGCAAPGAARVASRLVRRRPPATFGSPPVHTALLTADVGSSCWATSVLSARSCCEQEHLMDHNALGGCGPAVCGRGIAVAAAVFRAAAPLCSDRAEPAAGGVKVQFRQASILPPRAAAFPARTLFCALILTNNLLNKWLIALSAAGESSSSSVAWPWPHPVP